MKSYQAIHDLLAHITPPPLEAGLEVEWLVDERLAVGRDSDGRYVLLMSGLLYSSSPFVNRSLVPGKWLLQSGAQYEGTVLQFPPDEPFQVAVTTISVEFFRRGIEHRSVDEVFREVEGFVELVARRVLLPPESVLGLLGELLVLDLISEVSRTPGSISVDPVAVWRGFSQSSRDFVLNDLAIEVKTTGGTSSKHHVGSIQQIEPCRRDGEAIETLYWLSVGLQEDTGSSSRFSIAQLADRIANRLTGEGRSKFFDQLRQYGPSDCEGYDHSRMSTWDPYTRRYHMSFEPRLYDMLDANIKLIDRRTLQDTFVLPQGLSYQVELPERIPGSHGNNPRRNLRRELRLLLQQHAT